MYFVEIFSRGASRKICSREISVGREERVRGILQRCVELFGANKKKSCVLSTAYGTFLEESCLFRKVANKAKKDTRMFLSSRENSAGVIILFLHVNDADVSTIVLPVRCQFGYVEEKGAVIIGRGMSSSEIRGEILGCFDISDGLCFLKYSIKIVVSNSQFYSEDLQCVFDVFFEHRDIEILVKPEIVFWD
ncbi:MAG: uncharacterized protein A8A55_1864 [Amphiamblys sp. WSBS2006]|nr:MAG: uncharacterized protein A8A55_1864 [Amphiamblys sp. WSBS2006]